MLRSLLLLLCWSSSLSVIAKDRMETRLPRAGQTVDLWNHDLTQKLGRTRIEVRADASLYTIRADRIPTLHFLLEEQRFSVPGVAATSKAHTLTEPGIYRRVYQGSHSTGTMEKEARIEWIQLDDGRCQLTWKLSVINRGERLRQQEGGMSYSCREEPQTKMQSREALHFLPGRDFSQR
jgi:hypothetical protein